MNKNEMVYIKTSKLKLNSKNPRKNDNAVDTVIKSIEKYGFKSPIICDERLVVYCGNTRLKAAKKIGLEEVPCIIANDLTPEQIREFAIMDNKTNEIADWDMELLAAELGELDLKDFNIDWGFGEKKNEIVEDEIPELTDEDTVCKTGDIWQLGRHVLVCGDSTDPNVVEKLKINGGGLCDLCFTDPPYNVAYKGNSKNVRKAINNDDMNEDAFKEFLLNSFSNILRLLKEGGVIYCCYAERSSKMFITAFEEAGIYFSEILIWNKNSATLSRSDYHYKHEPILYGWKLGGAHYFTKDRTQTTVWDIDRPTRSEEHPTMKPVELVAKAIRNSSKENEIVLDLFGGSGTTLIAAEQTNRVCYMCELSENYCDIIIKRWEKLTGKKAQKIE